LERPDVLHPHSPVLNAIPALWLGRKIGIPVVYEMRSSWEDAAVDRRSYGQNSWKYKVAKSLETWVCKRADHVTVLCDGLKADLIARGLAAHRITPIPNGVDLDTFSIAEPDVALAKTWNLLGKKVIGFMGSFFRWEGLDLLIDATALLANERPDIALLLVGGGEMESELKEKIRRLHLETHVVMPGSVPQERIPGLYALLDVVAFPRYSTRLTEMVTPLKPLEAMAMGKAVVASDVGGHRELIQHGRNGLLFKAGDVSALTRELTRILDDSDLRHSVQREGRLWVRNARSWDSTTAGYAEVYEKVLSFA
jgi:PEP-CTERM/exosortase A-associated glycosyltransferase